MDKNFFKNNIKIFKFRIVCNRFQETTYFLRFFELDGCVSSTVLLRLVELLVTNFF